MEHPIVLPPHIEIKLIDEAPRFRDGGAARERWLIQRAAQLGADQELEACCKLLELSDSSARGFLSKARRPKPPSLKEQALEEVGAFEGMGICNIDIIRRALESLPDTQD